MSKELELLPCPFCGGEAATESIEGGHCWGVGCTNCDFQIMLGPVGIGWFANEAAAAEAWNQRRATRDPAPDAPSPQAQGGEAFADWLAREMPPGTVISNPRWWAPRILRAIERAPQRAPGVDDDTLDKMRDVLCRRYYEVSGRSLDRAYTRAALEAALAAPVSAGDGGEGRWLPSAAEWLDSTNAEASQDWRDGWDACRNRHATLRLTSGASGVDGGAP